MNHTKKPRHTALPIALFVLLLVQGAFALDPPAPSQASVKEDIYVLRTIIETTMMGGGRTAALSALERIETATDALLAQASAHGNVMSESALSALENRLRDASDFRKVEIVTETLKRGYVFSHQLARLIRLFSFDGYRETAILNVKNSIIDPINLGLALNEFDFEMNRRNLESKFLEK